MVIFWLAQFKKSKIEFSWKNPTGYFYSNWWNTFMYGHDPQLFYQCHKITLSVNENRVIFTTKFLFLAFIYLLSILLKQLVLQKVGMKTQRVILKLKTTIFISALPRYFEEPQHRYHHASELWKTCPSCGFSCYYGSWNGT